MSKKTDIRPAGTELYFINTSMRMPLKFGKETIDEVVVARVKMRVRRVDGRDAEGWADTPMCVTWMWPSTIRCDERNHTILEFCRRLATEWSHFDAEGHPMEIGHAFQENALPKILDNFNGARTGREPMPWLAALVCCSAFDIALHDAYGMVNDVPVYETYNANYMNRDLSTYLDPAADSAVSFKGLYPEDFTVTPVPAGIPAWHLVGGKDPLDESELTGGEPDDGYPVILRDWIRRDGLKCLKVKMVGNDSQWDYARLLRVGKIAIEHGVDWLTSDFNCTVTDPLYVTSILDKLIADHPRLYGMILYVEQPFPYELEKNLIDVHSVSARKPLFMDESAHDWSKVKLGRTLGWTGVALKTCKTQTGALLSMSWAKAHGMTLMVQDLTNPMLAQIPHCLLAAHAGTIMGVETNGVQFYPEASTPEAAVHPGLYRRRDGCVNISSLEGPGFGYRLNEMRRSLPEPENLITVHADPV